MKRILVYAIIGLACVGCASVHSGFIQSSTQLNSSNFTMVKLIEGQASASYFLGMGGVKPDGLLSEAKKDMYSKYDFTTNQTIANVTVDAKQTYILYPILYIKTIFMSADVIQFGETGKAVVKPVFQDNTSKSTYIRPVTYKVHEEILFNFNNTTYSGVIVDIQGDAYIVDTQINGVSRKIQIKLSNILQKK